jgi:hypothetical protein
MNFKHICILFLILLGCQKDGFDPNVSKYVIYGGMSDGQPPYFEIYLSSLNATTKLPPNEYEITIEKLNGVKEKAINGEFRNTIGKAGETYIVSWKLIEDNKWRSFTKMMPPNRAEELIASNVENNGNNRTIKMRGTYKERYFLSPYSKLRGRSKSAPIALPLYSLFFSLDPISDAQLKIWPPSVLNDIKPFQHPSTTGSIPYYGCNYLPSDFLFLHCTSANDFQNMIFMSENYLSFTDPFFSGKNYHYDYKDEKFFAITLFETEITDFDFHELRGNIDACFADITMDGKDLDTNIYKVSNIRIRNGSSYFSYRYAELNLSKNIFLFNQNNLDYLFTSWNKNCNTLEAYNLVITVGVENIINSNNKNKYKGFQFPYTYQKGQGEKQLKLDITRF